MTARGRPKAELVVTEDERETLARWARRPKSSQRLALRSRIVLACADGGEQHRGRGGASGLASDGGQVAVEVRG